MAQQLYARDVDGVVVETWPPAGGVLADGITMPAQAFGSVFGANFKACPSNVQQGWTYDGTTYAAPVVPPPTQAELLAYANGKQWNLATGGYTVTVNSAPLVFASDVVSMGLITGKAARLAQPNPPASFVWQTPTGFISIAAASFISVATQLADFVQSTFDALEPVQASIVSASITTFAAVDAATWPSNVSSTPA